MKTFDIMNAHAPNERQCSTFIIVLIYNNKCFVDGSGFV
jgi:hypothetical protein